MKTGIEFFAQERKEQIEKHGRTIEWDVKNNTPEALTKAAGIMALHENDYGCNEVEDFIDDYCPDGWDKEIWERMLRKPFFERVVISGALMGAALDITLYKNPR